MTDQAWIYFIRGGPLVKIGVAQNLAKRFNALRTGSPVPIEVVAAFRAPMEMERDLHKRFSGQRRHGEWFEPDEALEELIADTRRKFGTPQPPDWIPEHWKRFAEIEVDERLFAWRLEQVRLEDARRLRLEISGRERRGHIVDPEIRRRLWRTEALLAPSGLSDDEKLVEQAKLRAAR